MQLVCNFGVYVWLTDKRGIDSRLASAQTALMLQEETIRRNERERKVMADKINSLERSLAAADTEKRQQEVQFYLPPSDRNTMQKQHKTWPCLEMTPLNLHKSFERTPLKKLNDYWFLP